MEHVLSVRPEPGDVRLARDFCVRLVSAAVPSGPAGAGFVDDAEMITSELVTNSLRAGAQAIWLQVRIEARTLRIGVRDDAAGEVVSTQSDPFGVDGRGLRIVAMLAARWGVEAVPEGKLVWADLDLPGADTAAS